MKLESIANTISNLSPEFRSAINWFIDRTGEEIGWPSPSPVDELPHIVSQAKAIYKPAEFNNNDVALTVRQNLESPYSDHAPIYREDGTWLYLYHQEGSDFESSYTNAAMLRNIALGSPVAVLIQTKAKPDPKYRVQGIARVVEYSDNYFYLEGFNAVGLANLDPVQSLLDGASETDQEEETSSSESPDPNYDARQRILTSIVQRRGQRKFRKLLLETYDFSCVVSGCQVKEVLEAAHILPYRGAHTNDPSNGLILRTDLHTLFDLGLLAIEPIARTAIVASCLSGTEYETFHGRKIKQPKHSDRQPGSDALGQHLVWCQDRL
jgi:putative restriction endonuclease